MGQDFSPGERSNRKASCPPGGGHALPIVGPDAGFSGFPALTGRNQASVSGFDLEPPDQGLCTDGTFVMEAINLAAAVYDATSDKMLSGPVYLNDFFGVDPADFTSDPRCYFDPPTQRWFVTLTDLGSATNATTAILVAVSQSSDPRGSYNLYASTPPMTGSSVPVRALETSRSSGRIPTASTFPRIHLG